MTDERVNSVDGADAGWAEAAAALGRDLHLELTADGGSTRGGKRAVLARALRDAVSSGRLPPGTRLPPYRSLAADLGMARNAVADAYAELVAEGWLTARQGSGTRVAERAAPPPAPDPPPAPAPRPAYDLRQGVPHTGSFPRTGWLAASRRALTAAPNDAFGPGDPRGRIELRRALAGYLARARGVRTSPERIVVTSGVAGALRLLATVPQVRSAPVAVEEYGLPHHRRILTAAGLTTLPLPVDARGADPTGLATSGAAAVLLTPAHQFPTGVALHPDRRAAAVGWAREAGGLVFEDDYDGEFRYDRQPVGAVQGLDPERVAYLGSASKSLSPALRLGWMALPAHLVDVVVAAKGEREPTVSVLEQLTLADFIESGGYDRHLRGMRQRYRRRRDQLASVLAELAPHIEVTGIAAGLHAVLRLPPGTEAAAARAAAFQCLALDPLADFRHPSATSPAPDGLVVGYAAPPDPAFPSALTALTDILPPPPW
ncbi:MocR-like pyridoxine biosynthesis transcription factor PdxR [Actinacidiphila bryophytorum]|uniref:GntR family transcriptional regulator / MocR family aminotransferase n=2 Tax=Actinacidiphila bryophytorum TaxID=1436133 RepID=A0A9W4MJG4_9ACTN|nr:PLP-dependent aminotransferase family protein [Actinacidiphila bryophytorum]MBM9435655.1 PLP-dependent aminotransferase family protein [Actinacidiphila bryophytorum]CAG7650897.1 GntR family transcriptional regulator / MocR family aminotransferase [Actinacidiphila bryophytorum]